MTETIVLPYDRMSYGLKQVPSAAPWDGETLLFGSGRTADFGITDGWYWATDRATALIEPSSEPDLDHRQQVGQKVIELVDRPLEAPVYLWRVVELGIVGGFATTQIGSFDLDRVSDAAFWVACVGDGSEDPAESVKVSVDGSMLRMAHGSRRAAVMCAFPDGRHFYPMFDLPLERAGA